MKKSIFVLATFFFVSTIVAQKTDKRLSGLDKQLNEILNDWQAAGFAVGVVKKDKILYAKGFGYRDYENKIPVDANTLFEIGSSTKAFTSSLLGILREEGSVDFNESPRKYIPYLKFESDQLNNRLTVKDFMSHRSGLPRHDFAWYMFNTDNKDSLLQRMEFHKPFADVREQWYYNNWGFLLQGVITEKVTGKSWEDNVKERIFDPLGMKRSNTNISGLKSDSNASFGYEVKDDKISKMDYYDISGMGPAGSIGSSANDMAKWAMLWLNKGKNGEKQILSEAYINEAISSHAVVSSGIPRKESPDMFFGNYGYGWFLSSYKGHYRVEHGGNIDGFSASVSFFPTDDLGIVVLTNQNGSQVTSIVRNTIADRMLKVRKEDWNEKLKKRRDEAKEKGEEGEDSTSSNKVEGTKPSHAMIAYTGKYNNPGYGTFEIEVKNDSMFAKFPIIKFWLEHYHYDIFVPHRMAKDGSIDIDEDNDVVGLIVSFRTGTDGEISGLEAALEPTLDPIKFTRKPTSVDLSKEEVEAYVGEFNLMGQDIKFYTKEDTTLFAFIKGQPEYELIYTGDNTFALKILDGYKVSFSNEKNGKYHGATFKQPQGNFTATRKK
ncbi:serine hydrolase [Spongiivirga citrea]|uniref:Serine hydrolase n=1 Tax=Spongiivirga citrea TaxID=1481457 RepID=A0A6M0CLP5_9FLAO|nr:serine hydrolase [Spongiivirga citrea]NER18592.1 serine hydrolase [Spongiivirga citrea]